MFVVVVRKRTVEPYKVDKNIIVTAFNQASLDNATKQIAVLFKEVSTDWLPDSPGNLEFLENLTDDQVGFSFNLPLLIVIILTSTLLRFIMDGLINYNNINNNGDSR